MKFLKQTLGVHKNTSNDMVYGEVGVFPLDIHIKSRMMGYWSKIILGTDTKFCSVMYYCLLHLDRLGIYTSYVFKTFVMSVVCHGYGCLKMISIQHGLKKL